MSFCPFLHRWDLSSTSLMLCLVSIIRASPDMIHVKYPIPLPTTNLPPEQFSGPSFGQLPGTWHDGYAWWYGYLLFKCSERTFKAALEFDRIVVRPAVPTWSDR